MSQDAAQTTSSAPSQSREEQGSSEERQTSGGGGGSAKAPSRSALKGMSYAEGAARLSFSAASPAAGRVSRSQLRRLSYKAASELLAPDSFEALHIAEQGLSGPSRPVDGDMASRVESVTGVDVSHARMHTGEAAQQATGALGAEGFTYGGDVALSQGASRETAFHELGHVAQQTAGADGVQVRGHDSAVLAPSSDLESQADTIAIAAMGGGPSTVAAAPTGPRLALKRTKSTKRAMDLPSGLTLRVTRVTPHGKTLRVEGMLQ